MTKSTIGNKVMSQNNTYPHAEWFSSDIRIPVENLIKGFEIEKVFHEKILSERNAEVRTKLYSEVYRAVHPLYKIAHSPQNGPASKWSIVDKFRRELEDKAILDVGCGAGNFLVCIEENLKHKLLVGIDTDISYAQHHDGNVLFKEDDVVGFSSDEKFDVVFSDSVMEHIAPADLSTHLKSINGSLTKDGKFILIMSHRLFGPDDVTRIIDYTYTNQVPAMGTHLYESTYSEIVPLLKRNGFGEFKTIVQFPLLTHRLRSIRITPAIYLWLERNPKLLQLLYKIRKANQCLFKLKVVLISSKVDSQF